MKAANFKSAVSTDSTIIPPGRFAAGDTPTARAGAERLDETELVAGGILPEVCSSVAGACAPIIHLDDDFAMVIASGHVDRALECT